MKERSTVRIPAGLEWWGTVAGGKSWLQDLPTLVAQCGAQWSLRIGEPFEPGSVSWVTPVDLPDNTPAVLKINFPDAESEHEADALEWWAGNGAVRLLAYDASRRALLIERADPGETLWSLEDENAANSIAAKVLRRLWRPALDDGPFRSLQAEARRWADQLPVRWTKHGQPCSRRLVDEAIFLCHELGPTQPDRVVCHQDFHGGNVLSAGPDRWLAIDPKPLLGERSFDVASLLRDRREALVRHPDSARVVRRRLDFLTDDLDLDRARTRGWGIIHALAWGLADEALYPDHLACAELIASA